MKYFIVAGEKSGDLHGANLMKSIQKIDTSATFRFCGGDEMSRLSAEENRSVHINEMSFMGFVEVLANLKKVLANLKKVKEDIISFSPDALILIDYPGFNLKLAEFAHKNSIKVHYYISPKVWAWKEKRVQKIKRFVDQLYCILPFEVPYFKRHNVNIAYVGNPILDAIKSFQDSNPGQKSSKNVIALLPGSRKMEVAKILPEMVKAAKNFPDCTVKVSALKNLPKELYAVATNAGFELVFDNSYQLLSEAHSALVTSGTATLETALFKVPQVVCYKANGITIFIARLFVKIKFISLVNLILDQPAVKELIQQECNEKEISKELEGIMSGEKRQTMLENYQALENMMGTAGASDRVAKLVYEKIT